MGCWEEDYCGGFFFFFYFGEGEWKMRWESSMYRGKVVALNKNVMGNEDVCVYTYRVLGGLL